MPGKFEVMPSGKPESKKEETMEEIIERIRKESEKVGGIPQIEADLFGGETSDEIKPTKNKKTRGIARAQRESGPRNIRRRGNIQLERMIPPGDR